MIIVLGTAQWCILTRYRLSKLKGWPLIFVFYLNQERFKLIRDHSCITSAKGWVDGSRKLTILLTFSTLFMQIQSLNCVGGSVKVQSCNDVIYGWSLYQDWENINKEHMEKLKLKNRPTKKNLDYFNPIENLYIYKNFPSVYLVLWKKYLREF